jgi:alpha-tubulin suppressor-like RCC1 family protein
VVASCASGFDDCDGIYANGCEADLSSDAMNCGACGTACGPGGSCAAGSCSGGGDRVIDVTVGSNLPTSQWCVTRASGTVLCMGDNSVGQLGRGTMESEGTTLEPVSGLSDATGASAGAGFTCFERGGALSCAGADSEHQLGNAEMMSSNVPVAVVGLTDLTDVTTGGAFAPGGVMNMGVACARHATGAVSCWGDALIRGDGMAGPAATPVVVPGLAALDVAAGITHVCAVRTDNQVVCWGRAGSAIGDFVVDHPTPRLIPGISNATHVDTGLSHTCVRRSTGGVSCWGTGPIGQTTASIMMPVDVPGITNASDVAVGLLVSCALLDTGEVSCWGDNAMGQLGDGSGANSVTPVLAAGLSDATSLSVGTGRACVIRASGALACWGGTAEDYGVVGDTTAWTTPTDHPLFPATSTP